MPGGRRRVVDDAVEATEGISTTSSAQVSPRILRKIAVVGYPCVGKTSLTQLFVAGRIPTGYDPTVEEVHVKEYDWRRRNYDLRITDTAGHHQEFQRLARGCEVDVDVFVVVYAIDEEKSFEMLKPIHDKIVSSFERNIPVVVVGNKIDLDACRAVSREEGERLAREWGAAFAEVSARDLQALQNRAPQAANKVNEIFERAILASEVARGNMRPDGRLTTGSGSRNSGCSLQ